MPSSSLLLTLVLGALTVCAYIGARRLFVLSGQHPLLHPVFVSVAALIPMLVLAGRSFDDYRPATFQVRQSSPRGRA